jgi:hypothetical protein
MADQFAKATILNKLKAKVQAKGFNLNPDKSDMAKNVPVLLDILDIIAETVADVFYTDQDKDGTVKANTFKLGPDGAQQPHAYKEAKVKFDSVTDPKFFTWMETFHSLLQGVYPEAGYGAPNTFGSTLKTLLSQKPTSLTGKIIEGSKKVKVTI